MTRSPLPAMVRPALAAAAVVGLVTLLPAGAPGDPPAKAEPAEKAGGFPLPAGALVRDPKGAVKLFAEKVKPAELAVPRADFDKWVANLDSPQFRAREAAERELTKAGARVPVGWLRKALADAKSDEPRARLGRVLAARDKRQPDEWRLGRAVQVLERAGTDEAKALLKTWAAAPDGTQVAVEAKAALERVARR